MAKFTKFTNLHINLHKEMPKIYKFGQKFAQRNAKNLQIFI